MKLVAAILLHLFALSAWGEIIPSDRRITWWTNAGVTYNDGIPARTLYTNLTGVVDETGVVGASGIINLALSNAPANTYVLLPAGTLRMTNRIVLRSNKTLRGAGMNETMLVVDYAGADIGNIGLGVDSFANTITNITADASVGATNLSVDSSSDYSVGGYIIIDQLNDTNKVSPVGFGGGSPCSDCDRASGARVEWQLAKILSKPNSTSLTFSPPLMFGLQTTNTPQIANVPNWASAAGLEDLTVSNSIGTAVATIHFNQAYRSWIKNVKSVRAYRKHIWFVRALECEVRGSFLTGATDFTSNSGYGLEMDGSTHCLVEDSIFYELTLPLLCAKGGGGHVIGYNYTDRFRKDGVDGLNGTLFANHGPHTTMVLWEHNLGQKFVADFDFGSTDLHTLFRNYISAFTTNYPYHKKAVAINKFNLNFNLVGNVLGNATMTTNGAIWMCENSSCSWATSAIYKLGYISDGDDGASGNDARVLEGLYLHGNWDYVTLTNQWASTNEDHTLPDSLYLSAKPQWFSNLIWPAIGFDIQTNSHSQSNLIPAQARFHGLDFSNPGEPIGPPEIDSSLVAAVSTNAWKRTSAPDVTLVGTNFWGVTNILVAGESIGSFIEGGTTLQFNAPVLGVGEKLIIVQSTNGDSNTYTVDYLPRRAGIRN